MSDEPARLGGRLLDLAVTVLLAAMALYGAVLILKAIWIWLCVLLAVVLLGAGVWWLVTARLRGW